MVLTCSNFHNKIVLRLGWPMLEFEMNPIH